MGVICAFMPFVCWFDYRQRRIPNSLIGIMLVAGIFYRYWYEGITGLACCILSMVLTMCVFYPLFKIGTFGAGDVKLLGISSGYLPFEKIFWFSFISLLIAALFSLIKLFRKKYFVERMLYFFSYMKDVIGSGRWKLYLGEQQDKKAVGICLSGPVFISLLLLVGGVY